MEAGRENERRVFGVSKEEEKEEEETVGVGEVEKKTWTTN